MPSKQRSRKLLLISSESVEMKKIPETYQLTEDDLKEAITYWLNNHPELTSFNNSDDLEFDISFQTEVKHVTVPGSQWYDQTIVTATAVKQG